MNWRCAASSAAALFAALSASAATLTRGPYLVDASSVSAKVCWREDSGDDYCRPVESVPAGAAFQYELPGFKSAWTGRTLPPFWDPTRFAVTGEAGDGSLAQRRVARILAAADVQFVLMTGDVAYPVGAETDYDAGYFKPYAKLLSSTCFFPAPGGRDYGDAWLASSGRRRVGEGYRRVFRRPMYYSFDAGPVHVASIDDNQASRVGCAEPIGPGSAQLAWLENDLAASAAPWKIVLMHVPLYSAGGRRGGNEWLRKTLQPVFEKNGVSLVFAGDEPLYQRSKPINGVTYITAGAGGAGLKPARDAASWLAREISANGAIIVDASAVALQVVLYDDDGKPRDSVALAKPGAPQPDGAP